MFSCVLVRQNVLEKQSHEIKLGKCFVSLSVYLPPTEAKPSQVNILLDYFPPPQILNEIYETLTDIKNRLWKYDCS